MSGSERIRRGAWPCRWRKTSRRDPSRTTGHIGVETFIHLVARRADRHIVVGDVEDLVAEAIGSQAAVDHVSQVTSIDVGKDVAAPKAGVGEERSRRRLVDDVVRAKRVDSEGLVVGPYQDRRDRREVDDSVVPRDT